MKKLLIFLLILTSCAKSKQAIEEVETFSQSQKDVIVLAPKTRQEIRIDARNERVKIRQENRTDRRKSKDGVKLAKNENKTDVKKAVQDRKVAKIEAKREVKVIKQDKKVQVLNRWIWIVALIVLILFFIITRKLFK